MKLPKFNRGNKDRRINDDRSIQLPVYGPHDDLLPKMYCVSTYLADFEAGFEHTCKNFLRSTDLDMFNLGYIDAMIDERIDEALKSLDIQEVHHNDVIDDLTRVRMADIGKGRAKLAELEKETVEVDAELRKLEYIYNKGTSMEESMETKTLIRMEDRKNEETAA